MESHAATVCVFLGEQLADYHFGAAHPFGPRRYAAFYDRLEASGLVPRLAICEPQRGTREDVERFHASAYVERVIAQSHSGQGYLDEGDTPARCGIYEASLWVVGTVLAAARNIMDQRCRRAFVPIGGLHHARRDSAAGFCVFNDCAITVELLRREYGMERILYVDIDAHHGDGIFYAYEDDPSIWIADVHEDGRYLYPGTGGLDECGRGPASGTKLNIVMPPGADDAAFLKLWPAVAKFADHARPEFVILQCGADSLDGDPITDLRYSAAAHRHAASHLAAIADHYCQGRLLALGGGGYDLDNLAGAWTAVVDGLLEEPRSS